MSCRHCSCVCTHTYSQTHPKVDKNQFNQRAVITMKQEGASFPLNQDVGVLKWRFQTTDESFLPLSSEFHHVLATFLLNCWLIIGCWANLLAANWWVSNLKLVSDCLGCKAFSLCLCCFWFALMLVGTAVLS